MSKLCLSSTSRTHISSLLISDFFLFCSFIISHPLYFTYFIFFSPYLLKLLSSLSPLFITTSLLLLAFLTISPGLNLSKDSSVSGAESKVSFLTTTYHAVVQSLRSKIDDHNEEFLRLEDFEVFKFVFDNPMIQYANESQVEVLDAELKDSCFQDSEAPVLECSGHQDFSLSSNEALASTVELGKFAESETNGGVMEKEKRLECFLQELDEFEKVKVTASVEKKKFEPPFTEANKGVEKQGEKSVASNGSEAAGDKISRTNSVEVGKDNGKEYKSKPLKAHSHSIGVTADYTNDNGDFSKKIPSPLSLGYNLGSYEAKRKEKDWKRTLACKLFEERNNGDEGEGMDLLWETYEVESAMNKANSKNKSKSNKKKYEIKDREEADDGHDDEDESDGQFCCLQALKFSAGKMNLGMGRPNLVKISKAIKGIGWLHNLKRHSKKVHNGDRF